jgi:cell division protein FtsZ
MRGAKGVLINITGGSDITLFEVDEAANRIRDEVESDAHIIFGSCFDESMQGSIRVSVVATGIESEVGVQPRPMFNRAETRAVGRILPEVRTAAPAPMAKPAMTRPEPVVAKPAAPQPAALQQPTLAFAMAGTPTLAPASGTTDLSAEEKALADITAAIKADKAASAEADAAPESLAEVHVIDEAPAAETADAPMPLATAAPAQPQAAQAAAVAEALARSAVPAAQPRIPLVTVEKPKDVFIPKAPMDAKLEAKAAVLPLTEPKPLVAAPTANTAPAATAEGGRRISLFARYRSLTSKAKAEEPAKATPEPQAKVEKLPTPALNISLGPADRPVATQSEDELEIPAFLRRQAN